MEYATLGGVYLGRSAANKTLVHVMAGMLALGCAAHAAYLQPSYYGTSFSTASVKLWSQGCAHPIRLPLAKYPAGRVRQGLLNLCSTGLSSTNQPNLFSKTGCIHALVKGDSA